VNQHPTYHFTGAAESHLRSSSLKNQRAMHVKHHGLGLSDVLNATFSALSGEMDSGDGNDTNSTETTLMNAVKKGMDELGQGELQQLKDVLLCSPSIEK
jgi:hypothetical protein